MHHSDARVLRPRPPASGEVPWRSALESVGRGQPVVDLDAKRWPGLRARTERVPDAWITTLLTSSDVINATASTSVTRPCACSSQRWPSPSDAGHLRRKFERRHCTSRSGSGHEQHLAHPYPREPGVEPTIHGRQLPRYHDHGHLGRPAIGGTGEGLRRSSTSRPKVVGPGRPARVASSPGCSRRRPRRRGGSHAAASRRVDSTVVSRRGGGVLGAGQPLTWAVWSSQCWARWRRRRRCCRWRRDR